MNTLALAHACIAVGTVAMVYLVFVFLRDWWNLRRRQTWSLTCLAGIAYLAVSDEFLNLLRLAGADATVKLVFGGLVMALPLAFEIAAGLAIRRGTKTFVTLQSNGAGAAPMPL